MGEDHKPVGYWSSSAEDETPELPWPGNLIDETWDVAERTQVIRYLTFAGRRGASYRGFSLCRLCRQGNGSFELYDEAYIWPSGFAHYLEEHHVKPPQHFIDHVLSRLKPKPDYSALERRFQEYYSQQPKQVAKHTDIRSLRAWLEGHTTEELGDILMEAKRIITLRSPDAKTDPFELSDAEKELAKKDKIGAIKMFRNRTGFGLKEANDIVAKWLHEWRKM